MPNVMILFNYVTQQNLPHKTRFIKNVILKGLTGCSCDCGLGEFDV